SGAGRGTARAGGRPPAPSRAGSTPTMSSCQHELHVAQCAHPERGLAEREVEVPRPDEPLVVAEAAHFRERGVESDAPAAERLRIVRADLVEALDPERRACEHARQRAERRDQAAGEDVALDPVARAAVALPALVGDEDRLDAREPAGLEEAVAGGEERRELPL